ncbi:fibroblast growth factor receptor 4-like [Paramacrobiotus metropolitanus]|uniref:fibroblast growth factor receptor 4-like n=1 Tax=Paramacrobiotus metropolitanus TaxID=2943436 RepID=UPI0024465CD7|nr:fibroblast growth factor receptor 4-like [Paramacrobiotus metropolitanus]
MLSNSPTSASLDAEDTLVEVFRDDFNQDQVSLNWTVIDNALPSFLSPPADRQNINLKDRTKRPVLLSAILGMDIPAAVVLAALVVGYGMHRRSRHSIQRGNMLHGDPKLIRFAYQISRGMEFLHSRGVLHRDLAASNVLLFDANVVKISHFGMAHQGPQHTLCDLQELLPVRWMPPEAIESQVLSQQSDVWTFGVVLWEMFTMGATPYADANSIRRHSVGKFLTSLKNGFRLEKPVDCPDFVYV